MSKTPRVDSWEQLIRGPNPWSPYEHPAVASEQARELEIDAARWRELADQLAQRLRSLPHNDARDRAALKDYDSLKENA